MLLPEPVGATARTSRPASWASITDACPGRKSSRPNTSRRVRSPRSSMAMSVPVHARAGEPFEYQNLRMLELPVAGFILILMAAAVVAIVVEVVPVPYVSALALVGLAAGPVLGHGQVHLTQGLVLFVLLPGLLFEAAFNLSWALLRSNLAAVTALATAGVVLTTAVVALLGHAALG